MFFSKLKSFTRDYFTLTSRERRGAMVLAFIIILQICALGWMHFIKSPEPPDIEIFNAETEAFLNETGTSATTPPTSRESAEKKIPERQLFPFDPNTISDNEWEKLGLTKKQIAVIRNYLRKGGRFRDKESFSKMYCISVEEYKTLEPYISISTIKQIPDNEAKQNPYTKKQTVIVELNSADTLLLQELPLVGPGRARMIFRYREKMGGFYSVEQLREVFTIDSTVYNALLPHIRVDSRLIRKFNINSDSLSHPYIGKKLAGILLAYRKQHGNFKDISDLQKVSLPDDQLPDKIAPYVSFE